MMRRLRRWHYRLFARGILPHLPDPLRWRYYRRTLGLPRVLGGTTPPRPPWVDEATWRALTQEKP